MLVSLVCLALSWTGSEEYDIARREILVRRIGHELLLQSGDSTSLVLPLKRISDNEYQLSFEKAFSFHPELLVSTTQRLMLKDPLAGDYVVNVVNSANSSIVYGFAMAKNKKDDIVSCLGRTQPKANYLINILFKPIDGAIERKPFLFGAVLLMGMVGFLLYRYKRSQSHLPESTNTIVQKKSTGYAHYPELDPLTEATDQPVLTDNPPTSIISVGAILFDTEARKLLINDNSIELTKTEARVLHIFAVSPNTIIERSRLQKEIWEDEGVIVGRSLDMFISKLRKKLEADPSIKINVIRGKGYKLEI